MITNPKAIFFAVHWDSPETLCTTGTTYVCTRGKPLKFYVYSITHAPDSSDSTIHINEVKKHKSGYHHTNELPFAIKNVAPEWVHNKIVEVNKDFEN